MAKRNKVLCVEQQISVQAMTWFFDYYGLDVVIANTVDQALEAVKKETNFLAVVTALSIAGIGGGYGLTYKLRQQGFENTIVIFSGYCGAEYEEKAYKSGADKFVCKPNFVELAAVLNKFGVISDAIYTTKPPINTKVSISSVR